MKRNIVVSVFFLMAFIIGHAQMVTFTKTNFDVLQASIVVDENDFALVNKAAVFLQQDIESVTGKKIPILHTLNKAAVNNIIIGSIARCSFLKSVYPLKNPVLANPTILPAPSSKNVTASVVRKAAFSRPLALK